jgi:hypothetical protein
MATASDADNFTNTTQLLDCFCSWVHYHLLNPIAKGIEQLAASCKKRGSRQRAVKTLLAICDNTMLDRWIDDEDWVRQIQIMATAIAPF